MTLGRSTLLLGVSQLVSWGITYYLVGVFGELIAEDLGSSAVAVHGGFSAALVVMGIASPLAGRWIDRWGGRSAMAAGSLLSALGLVVLARSSGPHTYYLAWLVLGVAMRLNLYDAAFATLTRIGGPAARRAISAVTLFGGLASTVFWPIGHALAHAWGWRAAVLVYAGLALGTVPLNLAVSKARYATSPSDDVLGNDGPRLLARSRQEQTVAGVLYAVVVAMTAFLNSGMAAHMIAILSGLGVASTAAVWIASTRGIGQTLGRAAEVLFGHGLHPLELNLGATLALPIGFAAGLASGVFLPAALAFAFSYGAANGVMTITRGTVPLALFGPERYGARVGNLLVPSFLLAAAAPVIYAFTIEHGGTRTALFLSIAVAGIAFVAAVALIVRFSPSAEG